MTPLVRPFAALRPDAAHAAAVIAPPYDVVSSAEARALASGRPLSFLHVSRPEIDLPDGTSPYAAMPRSATVATSAWASPALSSSRSTKPGPPAAWNWFTSALPFG